MNGRRDRPSTCESEGRGEGPLWTGAHRLLHGLPALARVGEGEQAALRTLAQAVGLAREVLLVHERLGVVRVLLVPVNEREGV